jgi:hypothetical protein
MHGKAVKHNDDPPVRETAVFVSHTWGEQNRQHEFAKRITEVIATYEDLRPILDEAYFSAGVSWRDIVRKILRGQRAVVIFLFSPQFLLSPSCRYELEEAREAFITRGVSLFAVKIEECEIPPLLKDDIHVDMTQAYELFVENKVDIASELRKKVDTLVRGIRDRVQEYESTVHIYRVRGPGDVALLESRALFTQYPRGYRDDFESVQQWVGESADPVFEGKYFQELYYVAYYRGECVGVLYATSYRSTPHNEGYVVIMPLVVAEGATVCSDRVVARDLLNRLREDTNTAKTHCERYFLELPPVAELSPQGQEICLRGWSSLSEEDRLGILPGLRYLSPDSKEFIQQRSGRYEAEPMHLLTVLGYPHTKMKKKRFTQEVLDFIYGVYHAEAYAVPFILRDWVEMVDRLQAEVEETLPDTLQVEYVTPGKLLEVLQEEEARQDD